MTIGAQTLKAGTLLNTGLDVAAGSLVSLGIQTHINKGKVRAGVTCAACHAAVDKNTGRILEGAPNNDLDTGLILALASNSAAWFRQTGVNPTKVRLGNHTYISTNNKKAQPSQFLYKIDPTPGTPAMNEVIKMPGYPKGSPFILDGLMASSPGLPVAAQLNGMSAYQNTLAPPPNQSTNKEAVKRGAEVFDRAGCISCHSGRYLTNHHVIAEQEIKTQSSRAKAQAAFAGNFVAPQTYPSNVPVPLPLNPPVLSVPTDITPEADQNACLCRW